MIDLKSMPIDQSRVAAIEIKLPSMTLYLIVSTKGFLCGNWFSMNQGEDKKTCICMMRHCSSVEEMLESEVICCNEYAHARHIRIGMSGKEALTCMLAESSIH